MERERGGSGRREDHLTYLRQTFRSLRRAPGFAIVVVLTLGLGIGATTALFSAVDTVLLRPLPYRQPGRLALLALTVPAENRAVPDTMQYWSYPKYEMLRRTATAFSGMAPFAEQKLALTGTDRTEQVSAELVGADYFGVLGVQPARGRALTAAEGSEASPGRVVLLSDGLWRDRYGADDSVIGRAIELNGEPLTVIGVMPPGFRGLSGNAQLWAPLTMVTVFDYPEMLQEAQSHWFGVVARLDDRATTASAIADTRRVGGRIAETFPGSAAVAPWGATLLPLNAQRVDPLLRQAILVLFGAVAFVLLIVCANVANLLLARSVGRRRELAVRQALGASRLRLMGHLLAENLVLAFAGGGVGVLVAVWGTQFLSRASEIVSGAPSLTSLTDLATLGVDGRVLAFAAAASLLTGLLFGTLPALGATRVPLAPSLKEGVGASSAGVGSARGGMRNALVVAEVALAIVLLTGAGLMLRSFAQLRGIDPGFRGDHVLTFRLAPSPSRFSRADAPDFYARLTERLRVLPGVRSAAVGTCTPLSGRCNVTAVTQLDARRLELAGHLDRYAIGYHYVGPEYFRVLDIPLVRGRGFEQRDRVGAPKVVILNQAAALKYFPGVDPVGHRIGLGIGFLGDDETAEVVGVAGDVRYGGDPAQPPEPQVYVAATQYSNTATYVFIRTAGSPSAVTGAARGAVHELDPDLPIFDVSSMDARAAGAFGRQRFSALLLALFAGLAALLSVIGLYGVLAYAVGQRTREIGVRLALGARAANVIRLVVGQGLRVTGLGLLIGVAAASALTRVLTSLLYEVRPHDPATFGAVVVGLGFVALLAAWLPARRAARVRPMAALKTE